MPSLADLPFEVIVDNLLPLLPLKGLLALTATSTEYAMICSDDTFWKRKLQDDYNFADVGSARTKGYKFLYKMVENAKLYVWGSAGEGRLGMRGLDSGGIRKGSYPYPMQLKVRGPRIVALAAGGWSFHALDSEGSIHVWGTLDGSQFGGLHADPFSIRSKRASEPTKLILPERIANISCGRSHAAALSSIGHVWTFPSWGRPYVLTTPLLSASHDPSTPVQVECGWSLSAVLTRGGDVYVWWPFDGAFGELADANDDVYDAGAGAGPRVLDGDGQVRCVPWEVAMAPWVILPVARALPRLRAAEGDDGDGGEQVGGGERIVKIAAGDDFVIGLTEGGHVLKVDVPEREAGFNSVRPRPRWEYLEEFSEVARVRARAVFHQDGPDTPPAPDTLTITHISAHFLTFFAYSTGSSSIILQGHQQTRATGTPDVPPALQHKGIISIILGDYHFGALTATGQLFTWGAYSSGALGLGDPTRLPLGSPGGYTDDGARERAKTFRIMPMEATVPCEVKFGSVDGTAGRKSFVFAAAAGGWHTGALVVDLEDGDEEGVKDAESSGDEASTRGGVHESLPEEEPGWGGLLGEMPFRIGLAGAWAGRGRRRHS